jgi:hypothetical protein
MLNFVEWVIEQAFNDLAWWLVAAVPMMVVVSCIRGSKWFQRATR